MNNQRPNNDPKNQVDEDEFFGNQKDYVPQGGGGVGGYYREPMSAGKWNYHQGRRSRHQLRQPPELQHQSGVLSIHQPGWQERVNESEEEAFQHSSGILTIRQQGNLSNTLRWQNNNQSPQHNQQPRAAQPNNHNGPRQQPRATQQEDRNQPSSRRNNNRRRRKNNPNG